MNRQIKATLISMLVHVTIVLSVAAMGCSFASSFQPTTIDLSLLDTGGTPAVGGHMAKQETGGDCPKQAAEKPESESRVENAEQKDPSPQTNSLSPEPDHIPESGTTASDDSAVPVLDPDAGTDPAGGEGTPLVNGSPSCLAGADEGCMAAYLAEQFNYIKELIWKNSIYPSMARKLGVEGRVVLAFVILPNGTVEDVRVTLSSGSSILDSSALDAVRRASPFPMPPVEAEIVIPVVYRLR